MPRLLKTEQPHHLQAFERYYTLGDKRSYEQVARELNTSLTTVKLVYCQNRQRYDNYCRKLRQPRQITGTALFNAFMLDCERHLRKAAYRVA